MTALIQGQALKQFKNNDPIRKLPLAYEIKNLNRSLEIYAGGLRI
jgi:hypothetical protein